MNLNMKFWHFSTLSLGILYGVAGAALSRLITMTFKLPMPVLPSFAVMLSLGLFIGVISGLVATWFIKWAQSIKRPYWQITAVLGSLSGVFNHIAGNTVMSMVVLGLTSAIGGVFTIWIIKSLGLKVEY